MLCRRFQTWRDRELLALSGCDIHILHRRYLGRRGDDLRTDLWFCVRRRCRKLSQTSASPGSTHHSNRGQEKHWSRLGGPTAPWKSTFTVDRHSAIHTEPKASWYEVTVVVDKDDSRQRVHTLDAGVYSRRSQMWARTIPQAILGTTPGNFILGKLR